jgi:Phosphotransferase enzyme family
MAQRAQWFIPTLRQLSEARDHDAVRRGWPDDLLDRALHVCDTSTAWVATLARLPHTFQHGDADPRNLLVRFTRERQEQVVAVDWAFAGIGPLGDDVATLVVQSALWFQGVTPAQLPEFAERCLGAYLAGLHDAGWTGDDADVRRGMVVTMALRCLFRPVLELYALDDAGRTRLQQIFGRAADEVIDCAALVRRFVLGQLEQVT